MTSNEILLTVIAITVVLLLLVAGLVVSFHIATRHRLEKNMKLQEAALHYERELRSAETAVKEGVMEHISRELHDNIGHMLTSLRLQMEIKMLDGSHNEQLLLPMQQTLVTASEQLRMLSRTLNPEFLASNDLIASVKLEVDRIRHGRILNINFVYSDQSIRISKEQQLLVFRIFQESISNIIRHSQANHVEVHIKHEPDFSMNIQDNGKGFEQSAIKENGIRNMRKRAELADMQLDIHSSPGKGSLITLYKKQSDQ